MTRQLGRSDLVLCAGTVLTATIPERIESGAGAGYAGIGLRPADLIRAAREGLSLPAIHRLLERHDLVVAEFDTVTSWLPDHPPTPAGFGEDDLWAAVGELGIRGVNVAEMRVQAASVEHYTDAFGRLCDRALQHGALVHLEALPWSGLPDLTAVAQVVRRTGRPNGGVLVDTWHHFRAGERDAVLTGLADLVVGLQINDAPARPEANLMHDTQHSRLLPGEGAAGVVETLRTLWACGVDVPVGVEVMSDALAALSPAEAAARAADAARAALEAAAQPATSTATGNSSR